MHDQLPDHLLSVYRFAMHLCGDQHLAEDLTQEAMLRALRNLDSLKDPLALKTWLFRIVKNLWTDDFRAKQHQTTCSLNEACSLNKDFEGKEFDPHEIAEKTEQVSTTLAAMQTTEQAIQ